MVGIGSVKDMLFRKKIYGNIIECDIKREYTIPRAYSRDCLDYDYNYEYDHREEFGGACDYYVEYNSLVIRFLLFGEERIELFNDITLHSRLKVSDTIKIVYNKTDKSFKIIG